MTTGKLQLAIAAWRLSIDGMSNDDCRSALDSLSMDSRHSAFRRSAICTRQSALVAWGPAPDQRIRRGGRRSSQTMSKNSSPFAAASSQLERSPTSGQHSLAGSWPLEAGNFQRNILQTVVSSFHHMSRRASALPSQCTKKKWSSLTAD